MSGNLILHRGARAATLDRIARVATPAPTETWYPIPHLAVLEAVSTPDAREPRAAVMAEERAPDPDRAAADEFWANYQPGY
jgi:hypothetical protein